MQLKKEGYRQLSINKNVLHLMKKNKTSLEATVEKLSTFYKR